MTGQVGSESVITFNHIEGKYLTFLLGKEKYGVEILKVQEIIGVMTVTRVPRSPGCVKGVINLRGKIIPVIDLRLKFCMPEKDYDSKTCIIVVNLDVSGSKMPVGIVVDTVLEVSNLLAEEIEAAPDYGTAVETNFIMGMGQTKESQVTILINIDRALNAEELAGVAGALG
jgi:purine-binding chemotaxis protein CheW